MSDAVDRILVVDDSATMREHVAACLRSASFDVIEADSGLLGVELARRHNPDLVVCDVMMSGLDGYGVLRELRADPATATVPFVFLTGKDTSEDRREGMGHGADDYLTKPATDEQILGAVRARLARQSAWLADRESRLRDLGVKISHAVPHDFLTSLNAILGCTSLIVDDSGGMEREEILELVRDAHAGAGHLHETIQKFLLYAQLEIIAADPEKVQNLHKGRVTGAGEIVASAAWRRARTAGREADLSVEGGTGIADGQVAMGSDDLERLVEELVGNAFKFSAAGSPVRVRTIADDPFTIEISDAGVGMGAEQVDGRGAFVQFHEKLRTQEGCGLGLSIAMRLAELHGGALTIESAPENGTMVRVSLPSGRSL